VGSPNGNRPVNAGATAVASGAALAIAALSFRPTLLRCEDAETEIGSVMSWRIGPVALRRRCAPIVPQNRANALPPAKPYRWTKKSRGYDYKCRHVETSCYG
jgi:hypothetical protein